MTTKLINLDKNPKQIDANIKHCRERGIILPTFKQMKNPETIPQKIKDELKNVGLWDLHNKNLFRITWKNEQKEKGGQFGGVNHIVFPKELTGCKANIVAVVGKYFPTGAHKVGASYGCLAPRLVTGEFDAVTKKAVWPSTGNYCRGGAYVSNLLGCKSIAILPERMSKERFEWLKKIAGETIATHGCESNVKEIFDKCWELKKTRTDVAIFNQFEEFGNVLWHYEVTGAAFEEILKKEMKKGDRFFGGVYSSGSGGTMASGYYLKKRFPGSKLGVAEASQCPTLLENGFGDHRIEGIGDKHVPWIHDMKNTDAVISVDDEIPMRMLRLWNEPIGRKVLNSYGVSKELTDKLDLVGISGLGNLVSAIKYAKYQELTEKDWVVTVCTDSMALYGSRLEELTAERGAYNEIQAHKDMELVHSISDNGMMEVNYKERRRVHNLKYFTWIEQQARDLKELNEQWYDHDGYWGQLDHLGSEIDQLIEDFNDKVGLK